jgi:hypothetical protein
MSDDSGSKPASTHPSEAPEPLTATLQLGGVYRIGEGIPVRMTLRNSGSVILSVVNPDMGSPGADNGWDFSDDAYRIAIMLAFSFMEISVRDSSGNVIPRTGAATLATPVLMPRRPLAPGETLIIDFDLSEFYELTTMGHYEVRAEYGDDQARFRAIAVLEIRP